MYVSNKLKNAWSSMALVGWYSRTADSRVPQKHILLVVCSTCFRFTTNYTLTGSLVLSLWAWVGDIHTYLLRQDNSDTSLWIGKKTGAHVSIQEGVTPCYKDVCLVWSCGWIDRSRWCGVVVVVLMFSFVLSRRMVEVGTSSRSIPSAGHWLDDTK